MKRISGGASRRKAANQIRISPTDVEACLGRDKYDVYRPLYNVQVMTDLKTDLILSYTVSSCVSDSGQLIPLIDLRGNPVSVRPFEG